MSEKEGPVSTALVKHGYDYVGVPRDVVFEIKNSDALAIYTYLQARGESWQPQKAEIMDHFENLGRTRYQAAWNLLKDMRLAWTTDIRDVNGRIYKRVLNIAAVPVTDEIQDEINKIFTQQQEPGYQHTNQRIAALKAMLMDDLFSQPDPQNTTSQDPDFKCNQSGEIGQQNNEGMRVPATSQESDFKSTSQDPDFKCNASTSQKADFKSSGTSSQESDLRSSPVKMRPPTSSTFTDFKESVLSIKSNISKKDLMESSDPDFKPDSTLVNQSDLLGPDADNLVPVDWQPNGYMRNKIPAEVPSDFVDRQTFNFIRYWRERGVYPEDIHVHWVKFVNKHWRQARSDDQYSTYETYLRRLPHDMLLNIADKQWNVFPRDEKGQVLPGHATDQDEVIALILDAKAQPVAQEARA